MIYVVCHYAWSSLLTKEELTYTILYVLLTCCASQVTAILTEGRVEQWIDPKLVTQCEPAEARKVDIYSLFGLQLGMHGRTPISAP